uniref:Btz domain-containing protein n=1 Tax=Oryza punctata TaxID=4537 RepID=A0A0E0JNC2_ORYPU
MAEKKKAEEVEDDEEYESDLDDAPLPAVRRRAAASDDDEGGGAMGSSAPWSVAGSDLDPDSDSDGQGAAEMYDEEEEEESVYDEEGSQECDELEARGGGVGGGEALEDEGKYGDEEADGVVAALGDEGKYDGEEAEGQADVEAAVEGAEVVNKEGEAQAVPTIGAFYMHDDRFLDPENGRHGSQRKVFSGQKLWYPKDDNGRRPRGSFRAWDGCRTRGYDHVYLERTLSPSYSYDDREEYKYVPKEPRTFFATTGDHKSFLKESNNMYGNANNYRRVPSKFHTCYDHGDTKNSAYVQTGSHTYYGNAKGFTGAHDGYRGRASKPYIPHSNSAPEIYSGQYIRSQNEDSSSNAERGKHPSQTLGFRTEKNFPMKQTSLSNLNSASPSLYHSRSSHQEQPFIQRGKAPPVMFSKLFTSSVRIAHSSLKPQSRPVYRVKAVVPSGRGNGLDSLCMVATEDIDNPGSNLSGSASDNYSQNSKSSDQRTVYQERSIHRPFQSTSRVSIQEFCPKPASTTQIQSHVTSSYEDTETIISPGLVNSLMSSAVKTRLKEEVERPSFTYDEGHVHGVTGARLLVPSSSTGAMGATYNPPRFGSYYPQPSELMPSLVSPRDHSVTEVLTHEIPEVVGHQLGPRQNKIRRSKFGIEPEGIPSSFHCPSQVSQFELCQPFSIYLVCTALSLNYSRARSQVFIRLDHAEITIWIGRNGQWREEAPGPCFAHFRPSCSYIRPSVAPPSEHVHVVVWFKTRPREPT